MRILVAGGLGFIGGRVAQHLVKVGHQVVLGSRHVTPPPTWLPGAEVLQTNWNDDRTLENICAGTDVVIQAAGMNAQDCVADPVAALTFNGLATARLMEAASHAGVKRFIYLSTAHVYRNPLEGTITEETCPRNLHPYAVSHLAGENFVLSASQHKQIEGVVLRLSNAYGAPAHKHANCWMLLVNDLCRQAVETGTMTIRSSGTQQRDFVAMSTVCRVIEHLSFCSLDALQPCVLNVGAGFSQTVLEIAQILQHRCKAALGFEVDLLCTGTATGAKQEKLIYHIDRLNQFEAIDKTCSNSEIDNLLLFCKKSFSHSGGKGL